MLIPFGIQAQQYNLSFYSKAQGLKNRATEKMLTDDDGYLWILHDNGLSRFDGTQFIYLGNDLQSDITINFGRLGGIFKLNSGLFCLISGDTGLKLFNPNTFQLSDLEFSDSANDTKRLIVSAQQLRNGDVYICSESVNGAEIYRISDKKPELVYSGKTQSRGIPLTPNRILPRVYICPLFENEFIIFDAALGYIIYDEISKKVVKKLKMPPIFKLLEWPYILHKDVTGRILMAFYGTPGVFTLDSNLNIVPYSKIPNHLYFITIKEDKEGMLVLSATLKESDTYFHFNPETESFNAIKNFVFDSRLGTGLWSESFNKYVLISGQEGMYMGIAPDFEIKSTLSIAQKNTLGISIRGMAKVSDTTVLVSTEHHGLFLYNVNTEIPKKVQVSKDWPEDLNPSVFSRNVVTDAENNIWISSYANTDIRIQPQGYLMKYNPSKGLTNFIKTPFRSEGMVWVQDSSFIAGVFGGVYHISLGEEPSYTFTKIPEEEEPNGPLYVESIVRAGKNKFYIATNYGLNIYDITKKTVEKIVLAETEDVHIQSLLPDSTNALWIGTRGNGLYWYNMETNVLKKYSSKHGISSADICGIVEAGAGSLWLSTFNGIYKWNKKSEWATSLRDQSDMMHYEFNRHSYLTLSDTSWLFGGLNGVQKITEIRDAKTKSKHKILVSHFRTGNLQNTGDTTIYSMPGDSVIHIPAGSKRLNIAFSTFSPELNTPQRLIYRLHPLNKEWFSIPQSGELELSYIPAGTYELQVMYRSDEAESIISLPIKVSYLFYETWWFRLLILITLLGVVIVFIYFIFDRKLVHQKALQLQEKEQYRLTLFSFLGHEFKTPITVITGLASRLKKEFANSKAEGSFDTIIRNGNAMADMVNQLLELNRHQMGFWELDLQTHDIPLEMSNICKQLESWAEHLGVNLIFESELESDYQITDLQKLRSIINNLLTNAIKFSPANESVFVRYALENQQWSISVSDKGPGISEEDKPRVFDLFYQGTNQHDKELQNSGIGLAYVKASVESLSGRLSVNTDQGTTFTVRFPTEQLINVESDQIINPASRIKNDSDSTEYSDEDLSENLQQILIVEDTVDVANLIISCFDTEKYTVKWAKDGEEGLQKAIESIPDIIISDVRMPKMTGFELCSALKNHELTNHIPVILLTALADSDNRIKGLGAQADGYLPKPFKEEELILTVSNLLNTKEKSRIHFTNLSAKALLSSEVNIEEEASGTEKIDYFLEQVRKIIELNYHQSTFGVTELADLLHVSRTQLFRKIKSTSGDTPSNLLREFRLKKALELLKSGNYNISEIAYKSGFNDPSYFSKVFSNAFGCLPTEYQI